MKFATAYEEGRYTGRVDRLLNHRSEYTWNNVNDLNPYAAEFARGYRDGWLDEYPAPGTPKEG